MDGFPFAGDASTTPLFPASSNDNPDNSVFSDASLLNLISGPYDFSIGTWSPSDFPAYYNSILHPSSLNNTAETFNIIKQEQVSPTPSFNPHDSTFTTDLPRPLGNLPGLQSLESPPTDFDLLFTNLTSNHQTLESVVEDFNISQTKNININIPSPASSSVAQKKRPRQRSSRRISYKYRSLQKLMPWERRMDTASMLGEAYKYIKFLKAQVKVIEMMPIESSFNSERGALGSVFGEMGKLSRQQLLQVLLNTPEAQTRLYSQGCCVYSIEQLVALNKVTETKAALQPLTLHSTITS